MSMSRFMILAFVVALGIAFIGGIAPSGSALAAGPITIPLDESGSGAITVQAISPNKMVSFAVGLAPGDNLAIDLQTESDGVKVSGLMEPGGERVELAGGPVKFEHKVVDGGQYTIAIQNAGQQPAGFTLRVAVTHAAMAADGATDSAPAVGSEQPMPVPPLASADDNGQMADDMQQAMPSMMRRGMRVQMHGQMHGQMSKCMCGARQGAMRDSDQGMMSGNKCHMQHQQ